MSYRDVDGNECDGNGRTLGEPPERDHGLVSISEMNRRIAEAVATERRACAEIADSLLNTGSTIGLLHGAGIHLAAESIGQRIRERAK